MLLFAASRADLRSNAYNVMMVGDSSVGKTSFMRRAQSGKFSLDIPPSIGKILIIIFPQMYVNLQNNIT